jgi:DNA-binding CsgD family transcriptional regulator
VKNISVTQAAESVPKQEESQPKNTAGLLLMDYSLCPTWYNVEATEILSYPDKFANLAHCDTLLAAKVRSSLVSRQARGESPFVTEFLSGRRRYFCRAFFVDSHLKDSSRPCVAVLLERRPAGLAPLSQVSTQFNLTQREGEALQYLLQGLSSKAIANRMSISPNTVRAYMRALMMKTGVSSRSAIVTKIILAQLQ